MSASPCSTSRAKTGMSTWKLSVNVETTPSTTIGIEDHARRADVAQSLDQVVDDGARVATDGQPLERRVQLAGAHHQQAGDDGQVADGVEEEQRRDADRWR